MIKQPQELDYCYCDEDQVDQMRDATIYMEKYLRGHFLCHKEYWNLINPFTTSLEREKVRHRIAWHTYEFHFESIYTLVRVYGDKFGEEK